MGEKFQYCWLLEQEKEALLPDTHLRHIKLPPLCEVAWESLSALCQIEGNEHPFKPEICFCTREWGSRSDVSGSPRGLTHRQDGSLRQAAWVPAESLQARSSATHQFFLCSVTAPPWLRGPCSPSSGRIQLHSRGGRNPWLSKPEKVPC